MYAKIHDPLGMSDEPDALVNLSGITPHLFEEIALVAKQLLPSGLYSVTRQGSPGPDLEAVVHMKPVVAMSIHNFKIVRSCSGKFDVEGFMPGSEWQDEFYHGQFSTVDAAVKSIQRVVEDRLRLRLSK